MIQKHIKIRNYFIQNYQKLINNSRDYSRAKTKFQYDAIVTLVMIINIKISKFNTDSILFI